MIRLAKRFSILLAFAACVNSASSAHAVEYWWNQNGVDAGWGTGGTWNTTNALFSTVDSDTAAASAATTTTADILNFGTSAVGFNGGTITISATQAIGTIQAGSGNNTANTTLSGGDAINFAADGVITNSSTSHSLVLSTDITGAGTSLTLTGPGRTVFNSNTKSYTGVTIINGGTLAMDGANRIPNSPTIFIGSGAALTFSLNLDLTSGQNLVGTGATGSVLSTSTTNTSAAIKTNGNSTISTSGTLTLTRLDIAGTGNEITGGNVVSGNSTEGRRGLVVGNQTSGTLTLSGGTFTSLGRSSSADVIGAGNAAGVGALIIDGGSYVNAFNDGGLSFGASAAGSTGTLTLTSGSATIGRLQWLDNGTVNLNGGTLAVNAFVSVSGTTRAFNFNGGQLTANGNLAMDNTLTMTVQNGGANIDTNGNTVTISGNLANGGTGGLVKSGAGTITLSGTNTYTGVTAINAGTLALGSAGSIDTTSGVSLGSGGTFDISSKVGGYTVNDLSGSGAVVGGLTISNTLAIGNSPGAVAFEDLTLASTSTYAYEVEGGTSDADVGNVSGFLDIAGATLNVSQLGTYTLNDKFTLFGYFDAQQSGGVGAFAGLGEGATFTAAGGEWQISYADTVAGLNGGTGDRFVTIIAVPEPASVALLACGVAVGAALLRRRRNGSAGQLRRRG